jgi:hypothetical protein
MLAHYIGWSRSSAAAAAAADVPCLAESMVRAYRVGADWCWAALSRYMPAHRRVMTSGCFRFEPALPFLPAVP